MPVLALVRIFLLLPQNVLLVWTALMMCLLRIRGRVSRMVPRLTTGLAAHQNTFIDAFVILKGQGCAATLTLAAVQADRGLPALPMLAPFPLCTTKITVM